MRDRSRTGAAIFETTVGAVMQAVAVALMLLLVHSAAAQPKAWREFEGFEGADSAAALPDDALVPGELVIGRLMYPSARGGFLGGGDWRQGRTGWTDDYPKADRITLLGGGGGGGRSGGGGGAESFGGRSGGRGLDVAR